jgi:hypothetical protein
MCRRMRPAAPCRWSHSCSWQQASNPDMWPEHASHADRARSCQPALGKLSLPRLGRGFGRDQLFARIDAAVAALRPVGCGAARKLDAVDADPVIFAHFLRVTACCHRMPLSRISSATER